MKVGIAASGSGVRWLIRMYYSGISRRVFFVARGDLLGHWDLDWCYDWTQLAEPPSIVEGHKLKFISKVHAIRMHYILCSLYLNCEGLLTLISHCCPPFISSLTRSILVQCHFS